MKIKDDNVARYNQTIRDVQDMLVEEHLLGREEGRAEGERALIDRIRKGSKKCVITVTETVKKCDGFGRYHTETITRTEDGYSVPMSVLMSKENAGGDDTV